MSDTTTTQDFATTLGMAVHSALIQGCAAQQALLDLRVALDTGDTEKVARIIRSHTADGTDKKLVSIEDLIYSSLPRGGDQRSYG